MSIRTECVTTCDEAVAKTTDDEEEECNNEDELDEALE